MSALQIATLGASRDSPIFLGLPVGRLRNPSLGMKVFLNATATGVLLFLFWDVAAHAVEPVEAALTTVTREGTGSWMRFGVLAAVSAAALILRTDEPRLLRAVDDRREVRRVRPTPWAGGRRNRRVHRDSCIRHRNSGSAVGDADRCGHWLAQLFGGIGHRPIRGCRGNQSRHSADRRLRAAQCDGGFRHRRSVGRPAESAQLGLFGAPRRHRWRPNLVGTLVGQSFVNDTVSVAFLAAAAGSILYVIVQLLRVAQNLGRRTLMYWGLVLGLLLGFATDFVIVAAGA